MALLFLQPWQHQDHWIWPGLKGFYLCVGGPAKYSLPWASGGKFKALNCYQMLIFIYGSNQAHDILKSAVRICCILHEQSSLVQVAHTSDHTISPRIFVVQLSFHISISWDSHMNFRSDISLLFITERFCSNILLKWKKWTCWAWMRLLTHVPFKLGSLQIILF